MRLFFALGLDGPSTLAIAQWRDRHCPLLSKPVPPANFHLTLAFLGDVSSQRLLSLTGEAERISDKHYAAPFELNINIQGFWPQQGIFWIGPEQWPDALSLLANGLSAVGNRVVNAKRQQRFRPHITLSRQCEHAPVALAPPAFMLSFDSIGLYESKAAHGQVHYQEIAHWPLRVKHAKRSGRPGLGRL